MFRRLERMEDVEVKELNQDAIAEPQTIQDIVLREIRMIGDIAAEEMIEGYWKKKPVHTGGGVVFVEEYIKDTRKAYCGAVDFITDLVYPLSDKEFKALIDKEDAKNFIDVDEELKSKRKLFREINKLFEREGFFADKSSVSY